MADQEGQRPIQVPLVWTGVEEQQVLFANQFLCQFNPGLTDEFILAFGQVTPPILLGTDEQRLEQARSIPWVPVSAVTRVSMTRQRLEELAIVIRQTLESYDGQTRGGS